jgi:hypothetical protein
MKRYSKRQGTGEQSPYRGNRKLRLLCWYGWNPNNDLLYKHVVLILLLFTLGTCCCCCCLVFSFGQNNMNINNNYQCFAFFSVWNYNNELTVRKMWIWKWRKTLRNPSDFILILCYHLIYSRLMLSFLYMWLHSALKFSIRFWKEISFYERSL